MYTKEGVDHGDEDDAEEKLEGRKAGLEEIAKFDDERGMTKDNDIVGKFHFDGFRPAPRSDPQIELTSEIGVASIVNAGVEYKGAEKSETITIPSDRMEDQNDIHCTTDDIIDFMMRKSHESMFHDWILNACDAIR